jgi:cellulose synthase/poly-beta-1,6-N-acetylglucosamine synthase-like glycosyltransferase
MTAATVLFCSGLALVLYVIFAYPLLLRFVPARLPGKHTPSPLPRTVSVIIAVRNGEAWLQRKLESIFNLSYPRECLQVIVVSDGSTDRTEEIAQQFAGVQVISIPPSGKAVALNRGMALARNEILFFTDVRQELDPGSLRALTAAFDDPEVGVATGELIIRKGSTTGENNVGLYWTYEKWIRKRHSAVGSVLGATGAIYTIRRVLARPMPADTLLDDVYVPMAACLDGYRIVFVEEARAYDTPTALDTEFRRKVRTQAGVYQLVGALPRVLSPSNPMWVHFLSHKIGRVLLPFALVAMLISGCFLPAPWALLVTALQVGFYAVALLDGFLPERFPLKRVSSLARTFVVLMAAAACGAGILFLPSGTFWKTPTKTSA